MNYPGTNFFSQNPQAFNPSVSEFSSTLLSIRVSVLVGWSLNTDLGSQSKSFWFIIIFSQIFQFNSLKKSKLKQSQLAEQMGKQ